MNGKQESLLYIFLGQDILSPDGASRKDASLAKIKEQFIPKGAESFNLDVLHAKELTLKSIQEKFLSLPVKTKKRIILIKDAHALKDEIKDFLLKYLDKPFLYLVLILDINQPDFKDKFISRISGSAQVFRFKEPPRLDAFILSHSIELKKADHALSVLKQLLDQGEKPEWIMSGLRYSWERNSLQPLETKKRLKALLTCDLDIKLGRLNPAFALEKLVINLCGFTKLKA